jgi:hypothetical protein
MLFGNVFIILKLIIINFLYIMYVFVFIVVLYCEFVKKLFYNLYKLYGYDYFVYDLNL